MGLNKKGRSVIIAVLFLVPFAPLNLVLGTIVYSGAIDERIFQSNPGGEVLVSFLDQPEEYFRIRHAFRHDWVGIRLRSDSPHTVVIGEGNFVMPVGFDDAIDQDISWTERGTGALAASLVNFEDETEHLRGPLFNQANRYFPVRTTLDQDVYYGWIRMSHSMDNEVLTVHDWAWNSTPGEPIMAGEIPEPAVFALILGLGVLGFVAWRRRANGDSLSRRRGGMEG